MRLPGPSDSNRPLLLPAWPRHHHHPRPLSSDDTLVSCALRARGLMGEVASAPTSSTAKAASSVHAATSFWGMQAPRSSVTGRCRYRRRLPRHFVSRMPSAPIDTCRGAHASAPIQYTGGRLPPLAFAAAYTRSAALRGDVEPVPAALLMSAPLMAKKHRSYRGRWRTISIRN